MHGHDVIILCGLGNYMKTKTHPNYYQATVTCAGCGNSFTVGSTAESIRVDICSNCHPFFTGQKRLVDTEGRVERFARRLAQRQETKPQKVATPTPVAAKPQSTDDNRPKTLREMLQEAANSRG
jgi:large subunit ribosomal protein L31